MPPLDFYKNLIFKKSWYEAEVGGFPRLTLLPLRFKMSSTTTTSCCDTVPVQQTGIHQLLIHVDTSNTLHALATTHIFVNHTFTARQFSYYTYSSNHLAKHPLPAKISWTAGNCISRGTLDLSLKLEAHSDFGYSI